MSFETDVVRQLELLKARLERLEVLERPPKSNHGATAAPTTGDDADDGYAVGSLWTNVTADDSYICCDSTATAAVWKKITP